MKYRHFLVATIFVVCATAFVWNANLFVQPSTAQEGTGGTGGTLPEPTSTPSPELIAIGQVQAELAILRTEVQVTNTKLTENRSRLDVVVGQLGTLHDAHSALLAAGLTEEEWDAWLADWTAWQLLQEDETQTNIDMFNFNVDFLIAAQQTLDRLEAESGASGVVNCNAGATCPVTQ